MTPGLTGIAEMVVAEEDLVSRLGGMAVDVLSTPRLIQLLEEASINAVAGALSPDQLTLGAEMRIKHLSATPLGMKVRAYAILKRIDGNRLLFWVNAHDELEKVAEGEHERVLASKERFLQRVEKKRRR